MNDKKDNGSGAGNSGGQNREDYDSEFFDMVQAMNESEPKGDAVYSEEFLEDKADSADSGDNSNSAANEKEEKSGNEIYEWAQALTFSIVIIVLIFTFVGRIIGVEGPSMQPTLHENDRVVVSNLFYTPGQGDVVVVRKESFMFEPIVKRVIAVAGQTVDINFDTNEVFVDGKKLNEPYINEPTRRREDVVFPVTVPEGHIFIMGDNRNHSTDSRRQEVGMVDTRMVIGRVVFRVFPFSDIGVIESYDLS